MDESMPELIKKAIELRPQVSFVSYFKYVFSFSGKVEIDGVMYSIRAGKGGSPDNAYNIEVYSGEVTTLSEEAFNCISLEEVDGKTSASWNDF